MTTTPAAIRPILFSPDFADDIRAGVKVVTLRAPEPRRPPSLRDHVGLQVAPADKRARPLALGTAQVVARARLALTPIGVVRVMDRRVVAGDPVGDRIALLLAGLETGHATYDSCLRGFLRAAGFASYDGLYRYHLAANEAAGRKSPRGRIVRDLIGWGAVR